jgi:hypothetical protein
MGCFLEPPLFSLQPISEMQHCNTSSSHSISPGRAHQTFRSLSLVKNWVPFGSQKSLGNSCELPPVQRWYIQDEAPKIAKLVYKWLNSVYHSLGQIFSQTIQSNKTSRCLDACHENWSLSFCWFCFPFLANQIPVSSSLKPLRLFLQIK